MKRSLLCLCAALFLVAAGISTASTAQAAETLTVNPTGDTFVTSLQPTGNFATSTSMRANGNPAKIAYLSFDVTGIPAGARNVAAKLILRGADAAQTAQTVTVSGVGTFDPATVTYNTRPAIGAAIGTASIDRNSTAELTVPLAGNGRQQYAVTGAGTADAILSTAESLDPARRPRLEVTYTAPFVLPAYGAAGVGDPYTGDCEATVAAGGDIAAAITAAAVGDVVCVAPQDRSTVTVTLNKAITLRTTGEVKIKSAVVSGGATLDGFTIVGGAAGSPANGVQFSGNGNRITNNLINGHGLTRGIYCTSCGTGTVIGHNTITKVNNYGIQTANGTGTVIEWNNIFDLYDSIGNGLDVDAMRPFGTDVIVRNNYVHDLNAQRSVNSPEYGLPHLDCIQHYQNTGGTLVSVNLLVENNYCVRVSGVFIISKNNLSTTQDMRGLTIRGNVTETYGNAALVLSGIPDVTIENNALLAGTTTGPVVAIEHGDGGAQMTNTRIQNNVLIRGKESNPAIGNKGGSPAGVTPGIITVNQDNVNWVDPTLVDHDTAWAQPNPAPMDTAVVEDDFTAYRSWSQQGGPLADQGSTLLTGSFVQDVATAARTQGAAVDIGAYELG